MNTWGEMIIRFWGVRGSYPTTGTSTARYGGNTACIEVEANGSTIILDAGTGIIPLGRSLVQRAREQGRKVTALLLYSHLHHDHSQGFPFFLPAFIPGTNLTVYGPDLMGSSPQIMLEKVMQPPYFPVRMADLNANLTFGVLREMDSLQVSGGEGNVQVVPAGSAQGDPQAVRIRALRSYAHPGGVYHYRIDWQGISMVYATDTEGYVNGDRRLVNFAHNADLLIHDAQYTDEHYLGLEPGLSVTQGYGHSTVSMACQAALTSGAKQLVLFHHAPEYNDDRMDEVAARAREAFPQSIVAQEGMEIHLKAAHSTGRDSERSDESEPAEMALITRQDI